MERTNFIKLTKFEKWDLYIEGTIEIIFLIILVLGTYASIN